MLNRFPFYRQLDRSDCGPTTLQMICKYFGKTINARKLRDLCDLHYQGSSVASLADAAEALQLKTLSVELALEDVLKSVPFPCILHWDNAHYVVLWKVKKAKFLIGDPADNRNRWWPTDVINQHWTGKSGKGVALLFEPKSTFFIMEDDKNDHFSMRSLLTNLKGHVGSTFGIALLLLLSSLLTLGIPLLTQAIVDKGIKSSSYSLIMLIGLGRLLLYAGKTIGDFIRSRLQFTLGMKVSLASSLAMVRSMLFTA